jgi:hypothetical protein
MLLLLIILLIVLLPVIIYFFLMEMMVILLTLALFGVAFLYIKFIDTVFGGSQPLALLAIFLTAIPIILLYRRWKHSKKNSGPAIHADSST